MDPLANTFTVTRVACLDTRDAGGDASAGQLSLMRVYQAANGPFPFSEPAI